MTRFGRLGKLKTLSFLPLLLLAGCAGVSQTQGEGVELPADLELIEQPEPLSLADDTALMAVLTAEIALARGQSSIAIEQYGLAAERSSEAVVARRAVEIALREGDNDAAMQGTRRWLLLAPDSLDARQLLGVLTIREGDVEDAYQILSQNLPTDRAERDALMGRLGSLLSQSDMPAEVLPLMQRLVAAQPQSAAGQLALARLALSRDALNVAREAVDRALGLRPDWVTARLVRVDVLVAQGQDALALSAYRSLIADGVSSPELLTNAAMLAMEAGALRDAGQLLRALKTMPGQADRAALWLGQLAEQAGVWTESLRQYEQVRGDLQGQAQLRSAWVLGQLDRFEEAREKLAMIRLSHPSLASTAWRMEGEMWQTRKAYGAALQVYNSALLAHPDDLDLRYSRALVLVMLDAIDPAIEALEAILAVDPDSPHALNALGYTLVDQTDRIDEGAAMIERAYQRVPDDPAVIDSMGWAAFRQGNDEQALAYLERAHALAPEDPEIAAHLGEVLWVIGQEQQARQIWANAKDLEPDHPVLLDTLQRLDP